MSTPLSLEAQIERLMADHDLTQEPLAQFVRGLFGMSVSGTTVSSGLRGTRPFTNQLARTLYDVMKLIQRAQQALDPLPINWRNVRACLPILKRVKDGQPILLRNGQSIGLPATQTPSATEQAEPQTTPQAERIDEELVAAVLTGDYEELMSRRGINREQLMKQIAANSARLRGLTDTLTAVNADHAKPNL